MKKKTKTVLGTTLAILVLALGVGALGVATAGFKDWDTNNWGSNFEDLIGNKDDIPTDHQVESLDVDRTDSSKTYKIPTGSVNFGNSRSSDDKSEVVTTQSVQSFNASKLGVMSTRAVGDMQTMASGKSITLPQTITLNAEVEPITAIEHCTFQWEITWSGEENISDYIVLENATTQNVTVKVLKAFNHTATLKVTATANNILPVSATCRVEFYKQLTGLDLALTGSVADNVLNNGDMISYTVTPTYSDGTVDQVDSSEVVITYEGLLPDVTINYDFKQIDSSAGNSKTFDINSFYSLAGNFEGVNVLTGAGRNSMNAKLKSASGDFKITAKKGSYSKSVNLDIEPETVIYPESIQIGDGSDIEIGKN